MSLGMETAELAGAAVRVDPKTDKPHVFFSQMMSVWDLSLVRGAKMLGVGRQSLRTKWKNLGCGSWGERAARSETESAKLAWLQVNADMWKTAKVVQVLCLFLMESPEHYAISTYTAHLLFLLKVVGVVFQPPPHTHVRADLMNTHVHSATPRGDSRRSGRISFQHNTTKRGQ